MLFTECAHHFAAVALLFALVSDSDLGQTQSTYESISFPNHFLFFLRVLVAANAHISAGSRLCPLLAPPFSCAHCLRDTPISVLSILITHMDWQQENKVTVHQLKHAIRLVRTSLHKS
jgi:hypothetical protein